MVPLCPFMLQTHECLDSLYIILIKLYIHRFVRAVVFEDKQPRPLHLVHEDGAARQTGESGDREVDAEREHMDGRSVHAQDGLVSVATGHLRGVFAVHPLVGHGAPATDTLPVHEDAVRTCGVTTLADTVRL